MAMQEASRQDPRTLEFFATDAGKALLDRVRKFEPLEAENSRLAKLLHETEVQSKNLAQDKTIVDWLDEHHMGIWWNSLHREFVVQKKTQVVGCVGSGSTFRAACLDAMKAEGAK